MNSLFDFFLKLEKENFSGEIEVTSSQGHAQILVHEGKLIWTTRPMDRMLERLAKISWIRLPPNEFTSKLPSWEHVLKTMIPLNTLEYPRLTKFLKSDRVELFFRIFFWSNVELNPRSFEISFLDSELVSFYNPRRFSTLLEEVKQRLERWPALQKQIGSSKRIFISKVKSPQQNSSDVVERTLEAFGGYSNPGNASPFSSEDQELLDLCNGKNTVAGIVRSSTESEYLILQRLLTLWKKGALRPKDSGEDPALSFLQIKKSFELKDALKTIAAAAMLFIFFAGVGALNERPTPNDVTKRVSQAIDVFRMNEGHYPLTLAELVQEKLLSAGEAEEVEYTLVDPKFFLIRAKN